MALKWYKSSTVRAALIGAASVVLAAVISGLFSKNGQREYSTSESTALREGKWNNYEPSEPTGTLRQQTTIDLDSMLIRRAGSRLPFSQQLHETNASDRASIDAQPIVIQWKATQNRRIAVSKDDHECFPEKEYSSGQKIPNLEPGSYYFKITPPDDRYIGLFLQVISNAHQSQ